MSETLAFGNGGWVFFLKDGVRAFFRFEEHDRRLEPVEVLASAHDRPLAQTDFRNIPLVKIAGWVEENREALLARMDLPGPDLRQAANDSFLGAEAARRPRRPATALKVPAAGPYPAAFYRRVAQRYRRYVTQGRPPAKGIAEETGAPITTVHHWVKRARQLGEMTPAPGRGRRRA